MLLVAAAVYTGADEVSGVEGSGEYLPMIAQQNMVFQAMGSRNCPQAA